MTDYESIPERGQTWAFTERTLDGTPITTTGLILYLHQRNGGAGHGRDIIAHVDTGTRHRDFYLNGPSVPVMRRVPSVMTLRDEPGELYEMWEGEDA